MSGLQRRGDPGVMFRLRDSRKIASVSAGGIALDRRRGRR